MPGTLGELPSPDSYEEFLEEKTDEVTALTDVSSGIWFLLSLSTGVMFVWNWTEQRFGCQIGCWLSCRNAVGAVSFQQKGKSLSFWIWAPRSHTMSSDKDLFFVHSEIHFQPSLDFWSLAFHRIEHPCLQHVLWVSWFAFMCNAVPQSTLSRRQSRQRWKPEHGFPVRRLRRRSRTKWNVMRMR